MDCRACFGKRKKSKMELLSFSSVVQGPKKPLTNKKEPIYLDAIFEHIIYDMEKMGNDNNNVTDNYETIHGIKLSYDMLENPALIYHDSTITYAELNNLANQLARSILIQARRNSSSINAKYANSDGDSIIAVCLPPSNMLIVTLLACWKIGAAYLPIDPNFPRARIEHILGESDPIMVVIRETDKEKIEDPRCVAIETLQNSMENMEKHNIMEEELLTSQVSGIAIVLYTSGSTGVPKGVRVSHTAILNRLKWQWETFPYSDTERVCVFKTALTFVDSVAEIWGPLLNGRSLLIVPKDESKNAEKIMDLLDHYKVERLVLVPSLLHSILLFVASDKRNQIDEDYTPLKHVRLWVCSGETLSPSLVQDFYTHFNINDHKLCNFYGSTEVMGDVTFHVINDPETIISRGKVPIGSPTTNSVVYLLDEKHHPVELGETGEIFVSGLNLASGYVKKRDMDRFIDNKILAEIGHGKLYRTGDYGRFDENEVLYFEGRKDSQIKVRGHRVDLSEVDAALKKIPLIKESVVLAHNPGEEDQLVLAFVVCDDCNKSNERLNLEVVERELNNLIPQYMLPYIIFIDEMPLLVNGKVDRQYLLSMYRERASKLESEVIMNYDNVASEDMEKAKAIFETMVEVLGTGLRGLISTESNFFHLGGNSLNAVHFVTRLRDLGYAISISDFLSAPTLGDVIRRVSCDRESVQLVDHADTKELEKKYKMEIVTEETKEEFIEILSTSFYEKADLESYLEPGVPYEDYVSTIRLAWPFIVDGKLSFIVRNNEGEIVGAAMNKDARKEADPIVDSSNRLMVVLEFLDVLELKTLEKLPKEEGKILHNFMLGSKKGLSAQETIALFIFMEKEIMKLAKERNFEGVFTSNTNPLTQQLGMSVNNYETLCEYQANQYVAPDGTKPFGKGPDSLKVIVCWKPVSDYEPDEPVTEVAAEEPSNSDEPEKESLNEHVKHAIEPNTEELESNTNFEQ